MLSDVIGMAFYCIMFQRFCCRGWPSSGNTNSQIMIHEVVYCVHSNCLDTLLCLHVWRSGCQGVYPFCVHHFYFGEHVSTGGTGRILACSPFVGGF